MKLPVRNVPPWATRNQGLGGLRCILALLWLIPASVQAQTASPVQLDVGMDVAGPGQHVFLPVTLSTPAGATLSRVVLEATFSPAKLHYEETLAGAAAESAELEIKAGVMDLPDQEGTNRLRVEISSTQGLPEGELLRISFRISENAELNEDIGVEIISRSIETLEGEGLQAEGSDGLISVIANAFFACFFYMH